MSGAHSVLPLAPALGCYHILLHLTPKTCQWWYLHSPGPRSRASSRNSAPSVLPLALHGGALISSCTSNLTPASDDSHTILAPGPDPRVELNLSCLWPLHWRSFQILLYLKPTRASNKMVPTLSCPWPLNWGVHTSRCTLHQAKVWSLPLSAIHSHRPLVEWYNCHLKAGHAGTNS